MNIDPRNLEQLESQARMHYRAFDQVNAVIYRYDHNANEDLLIQHSTDDYTDENPWHGQMRDYFSPDDARDPIFLVVGPEGDVTRLGFFLQRSAIGDAHFISGLVTLDDI